MRPDIETILVNKKSVDSKIFNHLRKANPEAKIVEISTNTKATDPVHNLVSLSWKNRARQKRHLAAVLHRESNWNLDPNGRSTDFLPSNMIQSGCGFNCSYCYLDRHGPSYVKYYDDCYTFVNLCQYLSANKEIARQDLMRVERKDFEKNRDDKHSPYITVDIGCDDQVTMSNRMTAHDNYHGHIVDMVNKINESTTDIMLSFASKDANFDDYAPFIKFPNRNRIRLSLMPESQRIVLELNTSKIIDRISAINKLVDMGFEVHVNLSPITITETFAFEYAELLKLLNSMLTDKAKAQLAYEIIFLTHSNSVNRECARFMPKAYEQMVDGPLKLEPKWNKPNVLSYGKADKNMLKQVMYGLIDEFTPYARVRYMF